MTNREIRVQAEKAITVLESVIRLDRRQAEYARTIIRVEPTETLDEFLARTPRPTTYSDPRFAS